MKNIFAVSLFNRVILDSTRSFLKVWHFQYKFLIKRFLIKSVYEGLFSEYVFFVFWWTFFCTKNTFFFLPTKKTNRFILCLMRLKKVVLPKLSLSSSTLNAVYQVSNTKRNAHQATGILKHHLLSDKKKIKLCVISTSLVGSKSITLFFISNSFFELSLELLSKFPKLGSKLL